LQRRANAFSFSLMLISQYAGDYHHYFPTPTRLAPLFTMRYHATPYGGCRLSDAARRKLPPARLPPVLAAWRRARTIYVVFIAERLLAAKKKKIIRL